MKLARIISELQNEIAKEYGLDDSVIKIGVTFKLMDRIMNDMYDTAGKFDFTFQKNFMRTGEVWICGVQVVGREKDKF